MKKMWNTLSPFFTKLSIIALVLFFASCSSDDPIPFVKHGFDLEFYPYQESDGTSVKSYNVLSNEQNQPLEIIDKVISRIIITVNDIPASEKLVKVTFKAEKDQYTPFSNKGKIMINLPEGEANFAEVVKDEKEQTNYLSTVIAIPESASSQTVLIDLFPVSVAGCKFSFIATTKLADNTTRAYKINVPEGMMQSFDQGNEYPFIISLSNINVESTRFAILSSIGLNKGYGIEVCGDIYSPVNSGYDSDHPYGLLYQFARAGGQGFDGETNAPTIVDGPLDFSQNSPLVDPLMFYVDKRTNKNEDDNWRQPVIYSWPASDIPAPSGWTIPSYIEGMFFEYSYNFPSNLSIMNTPDNVSYWIGYNASKATDNDPNGCLFFPASGFRDENGVAHDRGNMTIFWMNGVNQANNRGWLQFFGTSDYLKKGYCAIGASVRCKLI